MTEKVATVSPIQTIQEAATLMNRYNVGSIPAVENGQVRGDCQDRHITLCSTAQGLTSTTAVSVEMTASVE